MRIVKYGVGAVFLAGVLFFATPIIRDELAWRSTRESSRATDYEGYLRNWPGGRHAGEARSAWDEAAWKDVAQSNAAEGLEKYIQSFPSGAHVTEARSRIEYLRVRQSPLTLSQELERYQKTAEAFPGTSFDFAREGGEVPSTWEVMRLYGGPVEWEGIFEGFENEGNMKGRAKKVKFASVGMMLHVYPSDSAMEQWQRVPIKSTVRYRGTIEGIAGFNPGFKSKTGEPLIVMIVSIKDAVPISVPGE